MQSTKAKRQAQQSHQQLDEDDRSTLQSPVEEQQQHFQAYEPSPMPESEDDTPVTSIMAKGIDNRFAFPQLSYAPAALEWPGLPSISKGGRATAGATSAYSTSPTLLPSREQATQPAQRPFDPTVGGFVSNATMANLQGVYPGSGATSGGSTFQLALPSRESANESKQKAIQVQVRGSGEDIVLDNKLGGMRPMPGIDEVQVQVYVDEQKMSRAEVEQKVEGWRKAIAKVFEANR